MRAFANKFFPPKVEASNPDNSCMVNGVSRWRLCDLLAELAGVTFTRKPSLIGSSTKPYAEFTFRELAFQIDGGGDMGGDGLWICAKDGLAHPIELREIRAHLERLVLQT
jgi:hypothetical protein